jgi:transcriptional regulator with XRE-family HTH domain
MDEHVEQNLWHWGRGEAPVGRLLALARRFRGLSQIELAARLNVSNANISRIEHGADLRVSTLVEVSRALQMEPVLIPKEYVTAVRALLESSYGAQTEGPAQQPRFA